MSNSCEQQRQRSVTGRLRLMLPEGNACTGSVPGAGSAPFAICHLHTP